MTTAYSGRYPFTDSGDIHSLCWNITDSIREEKGEEKKNITDKETGGQTGGQRKTTSSEMNVASSEKSSVTCGFSSERTIKSSGTQAKSSGTGSIMCDSVPQIKLGSLH